MGKQEDDAVRLACTVIAAAIALPLGMWIVFNLGKYIGNLLTGDWGLTW
jgi:hypothetical protein